MVFLSGSKTLQASYFPAALLWANILIARRTSKILLLKKKN
jgi:hypothetical protein